EPPTGLGAAPGVRLSAAGLPRPAPISALSKHGRRLSLPHDRIGAAAGGERAHAESEATAQVPTR
ncbi:MAG: hypothetical protein ACKODX_08555, partial [Gemmata sp.]